MNELIQFENGHLAEKAVEYIRTTEARMKKEKEDYDAFKRELLKAMEGNGITKIDTDTVTVSYIGATTRETFDSKAFKADMPELYDEYTKFSDVSPSIRIKVK